MIVKHILTANTNLETLMKETENRTDRCKNMFFVLDLCAVIFIVIFFGLPLRKGNPLLEVLNKLIKEFRLICVVYYSSETSVTHNEFGKNLLLK